MREWLYNTFWATWIRRIATGLLVAAIAVPAGVFLPGLLTGPEYCADGVEKSAGECIGVNGSGYDFGTPEISKVAGEIAAENHGIADEPYVTVALVLPLQPELKAERAQLRSELQGAYLAQLRANDANETPRLRLVLANAGEAYGQQEKVVDTLAEMADSTQDNLRAVTGFNLSLDATAAAIGRLTNDLRIPVLASRVSAGDLANPESRTGEPRFDGLARIIPTNRQQADALAAFHGGLRDRQTVLVKDTREGDIYVDDLAKAFSQDEPGPPGAKDQEFESPSITGIGDTGNDFSLIGHNICQSDADIVYFAGRPLHLRLFALKLAEVPCQDKRYTVVSGSGAATLDRYMKPSDWEQLQGEDADEPSVRVRYSAPAHPDSWETELEEWTEERKEKTGKTPGADEQPAYLVEPLDELDVLQSLAENPPEGDIGPSSLEDSRTMLVHDGVRTIAEAVFLANPPQGGSIPARERVAEQWSRLESAHRVVGASGWICLTNGGNAYDKPVAVVELDPRIQGVRFVGLGWPEGDPQPEDCVVPSGTG